MLPLFLPSCCTGFYWSLAQPPRTQNDQWDCYSGVRLSYVKGNVAVNFPTTKIGFSCLCGIAQCPVASRRVFQQPPSRPRSARSPPNTWCRPPFYLIPCNKMNEIITSPSLLITPYTMMWTGYLVFITVSTSYENRISQWLFYEFIIWSW